MKKSDKPNFFGSASIYFGANVINASIPFLLMPILTRLLTPSDYGYIAMFSILLGVFNAILGFNTHGAISVRFFQLNAVELSEYIGACIIILLGSAAIFSLIIFSIEQWIVKTTGLPTAWIVNAFLLALLQFLINIYLSILQAKGNAKKYGSLQIGQTLINLSMSLFLIVYIYRSWEGRLIGQSVGIVALGMFAIYFLIRDGYFNSSLNFLKYWVDALKFGVPLVPHALSALILANSGQFIAGILLESKNAGIYAVALQLGMVVGFLSDSFVKAYGPWLYAQLSHGNGKSKSFIVGITYIIFILFFIYSAFASFIMIELIEILLGAAFWEAKTLIPYIFMGNALTGMYYAVAGFFFFTSKTKYIPFVTLASGCVMLILMLLLGTEFGITGIATGYLLGQVFMLTIAIYLSNKIYPLPWLKFKDAYKSIQFR